MENKITPITILTGYLGAGKTTLMNHVLTNQQGYKVAVIVNDIGEVNIDAKLISDGGFIQEEDKGNVVPLSNGCICCTLKEDLMQQIVDILKTRKFDYILIEASGICEPLPIAQTITMLSSSMEQYGLPKMCRLDNVVTVVDALRLATEFGCGEDLVKEDIDEEDIENLLIEQIEFCNVIVLNKVDEVSKEQLNIVKAVIKSLQPTAKIIETNYAKVDVKEIMDTNNFDFEKISTSAGWIQEMEKEVEEHEEEHDHDEDHDEHECHHHDHDHEHCHHHHHEEGEAEEYGISTFVYTARKPLDVVKFEKYLNEQFPKSVIRCKGLVWFMSDYDMSYLFEQAGKQMKVSETGYWLASAPKNELDQMIKDNPDILKDWDEKVGDRMVKLVFIGKDMDKQKIIEDMDSMLVEE
jgi:G3E family GTPase